MVDWSDGDYALTAQALVPAAERILDVAGVTSGQRLLDVGCGTGNAALAAARRGARATGIDQAIGLLEIARARARREGFEVEFLGGSADALPVPEASFDVAVSSFGVIFAADPMVAIAEMLRAVRSGGCIAVSSWLPGGAVDGAAVLLRRALTGAAPDRDDPPAWHEPAWVAALLDDAGGRDTTLTEAALTFEAVSPEAWFAEQEEHHPIWRSGRAHLGEDAWADVRRRSLDILHEQNENAEAFAATSRYVIARAVK